MKRFHFAAPNPVVISPVSDEMDFSDIVSHEYNREHWKKFLTDLYGSRVAFFDQPILFRTGQNSILSSVQIGQINLSDGSTIDLFENNVSSNHLYSNWSIDYKPHLSGNDYRFKGKRRLVVSYAKQEKEAFCCSYIDATLPLHSSGKSHILPHNVISHICSETLMHWEAENQDRKDRKIKILGLDTMGSYLLASARYLYETHRITNPVESIGYLTDILDNQLFLISFLENPIHCEIRDLMLGLRENLLIRSLISENAPIRSLVDDNSVTDIHQLVEPDIVIGNFPARDAATSKITRNVVSDLFDLSNDKSRFIFLFSPKSFCVSYAKILQNQLLDMQDLYLCTLHRKVLEECSRRRIERVSDHFVNTCVISGKKSEGELHNAHYLFTEDGFHFDMEEIEKSEIKKFLSPYLMTSKSRIELLKKLSQLPTVEENSEIRFVPSLPQIENDVLKASAISCSSPHDFQYKVAHSNAVASFHVQDDFPLKANDVMIPYPVLEQSVLEASPALHQAMSPKLIVAKHRYDLNSMYDDGEYWADDSTNVVTSGNEDNLVVLHSILNSKVITWYLRTLFCSQIGKDGCLNYSKSQLLKVPFPPVPTDIRLEMLDVVNAVDNQIATDPESAFKTKQHRLDSVVNHLFGLTPEEIRMIDEDLVPSFSINSRSFFWRFDVQTVFNSSYLR